jgi:hypothetical protein
MTPPTNQHEHLDPPEALHDDGALANGVENDDNNSGSEDIAALPSVEAMEDLILEAYNNMQSDGEHIFLPSDVSSKLQHIAELMVHSLAFDFSRAVRAGTQRLVTLVFVEECRVHERRSRIEQLRVEPRRDRACAVTIGPTPHGATLGGFVRAVVPSD